VTWLELDGAANARDVGGLPTVDGRRTRAGVLLRSDNLQGLSAADVRRLVDELGVRTVLDLRTSAEVGAEGKGPLWSRPEVTHHHLDLVPHGFEGKAALARAIPDENAPEHAMDHWYADYLIDAPDSIANALRLLADPGSGTVLAHCAAGKDRTGVVVAVALSLVGVLRDAVVADYALSVIGSKGSATGWSRRRRTPRTSVAGRWTRCGRTRTTSSCSWTGWTATTAGCTALRWRSGSTRRPWPGCRAGCSSSLPTVAIRGAMGLPVVGMVGGGQLSRMTHQAAISLGLSLRVLADGTHDSAALVAHGVVVGSHTSLADLTAFAARCEVVTFDHEHVPGALIAALEASGTNVQPGAAALLHAQDKLVMRQRLSALGVAVPAFAPVASAADVEAFAAEHGWPVVLKAVTGGYDGKGVWICRTPAEVAPVLASGVRLLVEQLVPLRRELAAVVARSPGRQGAAWPVVETVQQDGICVEVVAPAPGLPEELAVQAQRLALRLADELGVVGVLAVELFESAAGLLVNELAMRPHNSAHWTIEGSRTSQFEQHLRAVLDYPMGATCRTAEWVVMANVLGGEGEPDLDHRLHLLFGRDPGLKVHLYGKQVRPGRKVGHVTALGDDLDDVRRQAREGAHYLRTGTWLQ